MANDQICSMVSNSDATIQNFSDFHQPMVIESSDKMKADKLLMHETELNTQSTTQHVVNLVDLTSAIGSIDETPEQADAVKSQRESENQ